MHYIGDLQFFGNNTYRYHHEFASEDPGGVTLRIEIGKEIGTKSRRWLKLQAGQFFKSHGLHWITSAGREWIVDADALKMAFPELEAEHWLTGKLSVEPEFDITDMPGMFAFPMPPDPRQRKHIDALVFLDPETPKVTMTNVMPVEIRDSLARFREDHPDGGKLAFIMMRFEKSPAHTKIVQAIRKTLEPHGMKGLRADDKQYHDDTYWNILTYIYGCNIGIAVFERITKNDFNPNVSLEVGYMMGLRREVCLLKDKNLSNLHTDLVGKLYRAFDPQEIGKTIEREMNRWLSDKGII